MAGISLFDGVRLWFRRRARDRRVTIAKTWPLALGEVLGWRTVPAHEDVASLSSPDQIEAGYYFTVNGEYFGGHFRSVPMSRLDVSRIAPTTPKVQVRYNPADPDSAVVMAEDNVGTLPFQVLSGD